MATAQLNNLNVVSATYGGADCTAWVQKQFGNYIMPLGNTGTKWNITIGNTFFGFDPNPGIPKSAVITYRYFLEQPSINDRAEYYSPCQTVAGTENQTITISPVGQTFQTFHWPAPTSVNETIVAAYWSFLDVTAAVQAQWTKSTSNPDLTNGTAITVSSDLLGPDPWSGVKKSFTVVLGRHINNQWYFDTRVDIQSPMSWTLNIPPAIPAISKRRLNIYSAVWGGQDYSAFVRNRYISDILGVTYTPENVISNTQNTWSFEPNVTTLGPDPLPGTQKAFTIVYRIAALKGTETGNIINPSAPACWTEAWYDQQPPLLSIPNCPIMGDVSGFHVATVLDGGKVTIDLTQADMTPLLGAGPFMAATYHNIDVTETANNNLALGRQNFTISPQSFNMSDPAVGTKKQFAATMAYPLATQQSMQIRTYAALDGTSFSMPNEAPAINVQYPLPYQPRTYRKIKFTDHGLANVWPQIYNNGSNSVRWCPRPDWADIISGSLGKFGMTSICE